MLLEIVQFYLITALIIAIKKLKGKKIVLPFIIFGRFFDIDINVEK